MAITSQLGQATGSLLGTSMQDVAKAHAAPYPSMVFRGFIEVAKATNGYIVSISRGVGNVGDVSVAKTVEEVNQIIAAAMVSFRLEQ